MERCKWEHNGNAEGVNMAKEENKMNNVRWIMVAIIIVVMVVALFMLFVREQKPTQDEVMLMNFEHNRITFDQFIEYNDAKSIQQIRTGVCVGIVFLGIGAMIHGFAIVKIRS